MRRIIDKIIFEDKLRDRIRDKYIKTSSEDLDIIEIMIVFEECEK